MPVIEIKKFSDKIQEFQKALIDYHKICQMISKVQEQVSPSQGRKTNELRAVIASQPSVSIGKIAAGWNLGTRTYHFRFAASELPRS